MPDNYAVRDGNGTLTTFKSKDIGAGVQLMQSVSSDALGVPYDAANPLPLYVPQYADVIVGSTVTRPGDTIAYAAGDLLANSVTAGSVVPVSFTSATRLAAGVGRIERLRLRKTGTSLTNALFRVHLFNATPSTIANGDNGALLTSIAGYIGACDVTMDRAFSDGAHGVGLPTTFTPLTFKLGAGTTLFALIEVRGAYTPVSAEIFTTTVEIYRL